MDRRALLLLGGTALASVGGVVLLSPELVGGRGAPDLAGRLAFEGLTGRLAGAARIEVTGQGGKLVLLREGEGWVLPDRGNYPVRAEKARELLVGLTELRLVEARTADAALLDRLGVDNPLRPGSTALLLRVLDARGTALVELVVGRRRVRTQGNLPESVYVRRPEEAQAWLAEGRLALDPDPQAWLDRDVVNIAADRVRRVTVERVGAQPLVLGRRPGQEGRLQVLDPPDPPSADTVTLDEVARAFEFLSFLEVRPAAEIPGEALGEARFELTDGTLLRVWPHRDGETLWARLRAEGSEQAGVWNARWTPWAYQFGVWKEKAFVPRLEDLLEPEAPAAPPR